MNLFAIDISGSISPKDYQKMAHYVCEVIHHDDVVIFVDHKVYYNDALSSTAFKIKTNNGDSPTIIGGGGGSNGIFELDHNYLKHYPDCNKIYYLTDYKSDHKTYNVKWIALEDENL